MVTFSIPGDGDIADASRGTPKSRAPLPFAQRAYAASPYGSISRGTPRGASARKQLMTRDDVPASSLNNSSIATARNIFKASAIVDSPPATNTFSPSLPQSTKKMLFAPGSTPDPSRKHRESMAQATPRGMASKDLNKELFPMKIASPPPELSGEALSRKVPRDWNSKSSIYADQYLAHLCPPELDDEQRRQFFCILDLRRLKYAADEVFVKKGWKLNIINFAKEFEKSRSIILLRYGLYEFQNVKPSKDVVKRWRREHGLPDPEDDSAAGTPTKPAASKKRRGDDLVKESSDAGASKAKRRATERNEEEPAPDASALNKNKRKTLVSDDIEEQPSKMQKPTPSKAKSLFEKVASKPATPASTTPAKPNPFAAAKPTNGSLARSVFNNVKPGAAQSSAGGNIFGHLSDASSNKNSGAEGDVESETDSEPEESQEAGQQSDAPSLAETGSQLGASLFGKKAAATSEPSKEAETRESTPGKSLFDRVTKASNGEPARAEMPSEETPAAVDKTWNPTTTPLKFAPSAPTPPAGSLFGSSTATPSSSLFAPKATSSSSIFGAPKQDQPAAKESSAEAAATDKDGDESDKENDSQAPNKTAPEAKPAPSQPAFGSSSLFSPKPAATETSKDTEPPKSIFGSSTPAAPASTGLFGATSKPSEASSTQAPVMQSTTLFGTKPSEPEKQPATEAPKSEPKFGTTSQGLFGPGSQSSKPPGTDKSSPLFGAKPSGNAASVFSNVSGSAKPTFGAPSSGGDSAAATPAPAPAATQPASTPLFSFGAASTTSDKPSATPQLAAKPLFGAPKSPPSNAANNSIFSGSPMKQDEPSPAKRAFTGGSSADAAAPKFAFGSAAPPSTGLFGASSTPAATNGATSSINFGAGSSTANGGSGGFNFSFGAGAAPASTGAAGATGSTFNNPFASGTGGSNAGSMSTPASGGMFNFGGATAPSAGGSSSFQFGGANGGSSTPAGSSLFGGAQTNNNSNATPSFGGASTPGGGPVFNFTSASPQPAKGETGSVFASNPNPPFGNLQPPAGGASTTGTSKSPFPHRKIAPLKRRV